MLALDWCVQLPRFKGQFRLFLLLTRLFPTSSTRARYVDVRLSGPPGDLTYMNAVLRRGDDLVGRIINRYPPTTSFIDVGANIGVYALHAAKRFGQGHVFAIEPNPMVFQYLFRNMELNRLTNVSLCCAAVFSEGQSMIPLGFSPGHLGGATVAEGGAASIDVLTINKTWFDQISDRIQPGSLLKIDVEGAERMVLQQILASQIVPKIEGILVEMSREPDNNKSDEFVRNLESLGFHEESREEQGNYYDAYYCRGGGGS